MHGYPLSLNQAFGAFKIISGDSMLKSFNLKTIIFMPFTGSNMVFRNFFGILLLQSLTQKLNKEMVITVSTPFVIQGDKEQVGLFEIIQGLLAIILTSNCIAQRAVQSIENCCLKQKFLNAFGLLV